MSDPTILEIFNIREEEYDDWQEVMEIVTAADENTPAGEILIRCNEHFIKFPGPPGWKPPRDEQILSWIMIAFKNYAENKKSESRAAASMQPMDLSTKEAAAIEQALADGTARPKIEVKPIA